MLQEIRKRQGRSPTPPESTDFDHIASLLPKIGAGDEDDESEWDEHLRELSIHLLRLFWIQAWSQLDSLEQETELLHNAPPSPKSKPQTTPENDAGTWRLDAPPPNIPSGRGPLLDQSGKVTMRSFIPSAHFLGYISASEAVHDTCRRCNRQGPSPRRGVPV